MSAITQRDQAISLLNKNLRQLIKLYKECYLSRGRGALLVYARNVISNVLPNQDDYRTEEEILEVFTSPDSYAQLKEMITHYDQKNEGILALITDFANATYFITVKFK
ncbi:hypothetical protein [Methylotuvimicrobium alcaliphilum]|uniref:hypothetical protein n=1 Tax=Methylotuvimicrobium alcaliphilum TaxID=271065 RepID=UPI003B5921C6